MSRPKITSEMVAKFTESSPGRLIRKLDKAPDRAESWVWNYDSDTTTILTSGGALVSLSGAVISTQTQVSCDCLLAPKCLHILSVVTRLDLSEALDCDEPGETDEEEVILSMVQPSSEQKEAALELQEACAEILASGLSMASIVAQGKLLRALHNGRVVGLHRAASAATRCIVRIRKLRTGQRAKLDLLQEDIRDILESCESVIGKETLSVAEMGVGRRKYHDAGSLKLQGIVTTAIGGDGGYGGCVTYFLDEKGSFSTVSTVNPREMGGTKDAWLTSVQIGDVVASHKELCRKMIFIQNATRSDDGRLGAGKRVKAVVGKDVNFEESVLVKWFSKPLSKQIDKVYENAELPYLTRPPGWDFITFEALIVGKNADDGVVLRPVVGPEEEEVFGTPILGTNIFDSKGNIERLSTMVGSRFRFIARVDIDEIRKVSLVTIIYEGSDQKKISVQLGLEHFQIERTREDLLVDFHTIPPVWESFDRNMERAMLGGWRAFPPQAISNIRKEQAKMRSVGMHYGASQLKAMYDSSQSTESHKKADSLEFAKTWESGLQYREAFVRAISREQWN